MIEAMKQALEALEVATTPLAKDRQEVLQAQSTLRQAIAEAEKQERFFCERCGKRLSGGIHTCTPPAEAEKQEPVAWRYIGTSCLGHGKIYGNWTDGKPPKVVELANKDKNWSIELAYTHLPKREWVGLTDEEWQDLSDRYGMILFGKFKNEIEAKLKEKNT